LGQGIGEGIRGFKAAINPEKEEKSAGPTDTAPAIRAEGMRARERQAGA